MQSTISAQEFQRFQSQLLDLREANIEANDRCLKAETRIRQLESELKNARKSADASNSDRTRMDEVDRENKRLREKLQSTETAFQLQCSTLRAECVHLSAELSRVQQTLVKQTHTQSCQTTLNPRIDVSVQTADQPSDALEVGTHSSHEVAELRTALETSNTTLALYRSANQTFENKLSQLETIVNNDLTQLHKRLKVAQTEYQDLLTRLQSTQGLLEESEDVQQDLRTQLGVLRQRNEKVQRELRRQLTRLLRSQHTESVEQLSLHKSSLYSSSSSISSALNCTAPGSLPNGECSSGQPVTSDSGETKHSDIPPGFFSMADLKALIDRLSEVQEENCVFRRHIYRLEQELASKSKALQMELDKCLQGAQGTHSVGNKVDHPNLSSNPHSTSNASFPWLNALKSTLVVNNSPGMSSSQLESVNRLKLMCEQLVTQNIQLSEQLERLKSNK